jgi:outer membrane protein OmpA-like peptidoglycan-associated protein
MQASLAATICLSIALGACASTGPAPALPAASAQLPPAPAASPAAASAASSAASKESLKISFVSASASLSPEALAQLDGAARLYRDAQPTIMIVSGQADRQGEEFSNLLLSARRANIVRKALVDRGVPAARLQMIALGDTEATTNLSPSRAVVVTWR